MVFASILKINYTFSINKQTQNDRKFVIKNRSVAAIKFYINARLFHHACIYIYI